jgi:hypothetical protein
MLPIEMVCVKLVNLENIIASKVSVSVMIVALEGITPPLAVQLV